MVNPMLRSALDKGSTIDIFTASEAEFYADEGPRGLSVIEG